MEPGQRGSKLVAGLLAAVVLALAPGGGSSGAAVAADGPGADLPFVEPNPVADAASGAEAFSSPHLTDQLSDLPEGAQEVAPDVAWVDVAGLPVEVRESRNVTTLPDGGGGAASTSPVPGQDGSDADVTPAVDVIMHGTGSESTPAVLVDVAEASGSAVDEVVPDASPATPTAEPSPTGSVGAGESGTGGVRAVDIRVSYADFRHAFAGDWGSRLRVVAYPSCVQTTPDQPECSEGTIVPSVNDPAKETVTFTTANLNEGAPAEVSPSASATRARVTQAAVLPAATTGTGTTYALTASGSGDTGDYGATPSGSTQSWQVGESAGDFSYSYPIEVPPAAVAGPLPTLNLDYDSGSVDGMTKAANGQSSMIGMGWNLDPGHIERQYARCADDGMSTKGDLCWTTDSTGHLVQRLSIVLNGHSSELVQIGSTSRYRLQDDPGWQVNLIANATPAADEPDNTDNNNEAFKVRAPDGTAYWFGWGHGSGGTLQVPVFGNDPGEPCDSSTTASSWCQQAWRWNLDRVVDRHGNEINYSYTHETNYYARYASTATGNRQVYDRNGFLSAISYGSSRASGSGDYSAITVSTKLRCVQLLTNPSYDCTGSHGPRADPDSWPDVPGDLICDSNDTCLNASPTFFSTRRYDAITTKRWSGVTYVADTYQMAFQFPSPGTNGIQDLWLSSVTRSSPYTDALPATAFSGTFLRNRVVTPSGSYSFNKLRVSSVRNQTGGRIDVVYGHDSSRECAPGALPSTRYNSTRECFPQKINGSWEWWHKYVVTKVGLGDDAMGYRLGQAANDAPNLGRLRVFEYEYLGTPGWRWRNNPVVPNADETWDDWRGYQTVVVHERRVGSNQYPDGDGSDLSRRKVISYRGLDNTRLNDTSVDRRDESVVTGRGTFPDSPWLAGRVAEELDLDGAGVALTRHHVDYGAYVTAANPVPFDHDAVYVYPRLTFDISRIGGPERLVFRAVDDGGTDHTSARLGAVWGEVDNQGTANDTSDDIATCTDWVTNGGTALRAPASIKTRIKDCGPASTVVSRSDYFYDGSSTAPTSLGPVGDQTMVANYVDATRTVRTQIRYDGYGRITGTSNRYYQGDPVFWTGTVYNPGGDPDNLTRSVRTTTPADPSTDTPALVTTTTLDIRRNQPTEVVDPNGQRTTIARDGLGRAAWVDLPGHPAGLHSLTYVYATRAGSPSTVTTTRLRTSGGAGDRSYAFYDGWGRQIETQQLNQAGDGRVVSGTGYDETGASWVAMPSVPAAGTTAQLLNAAPADVAHYATTQRDALGRPITEVEYTGTSQQLVTRSTYAASATGGYDTVATMRPGASTASLTRTRTEYDLVGRVAKVSQYGNGVDADPSKDDGVATYTYTPLGALATISTAKSSSPTDLMTYGYAYDWLGRRTRAADPDTGTTTYEYDAAGNTTRVAGAMAASTGAITTDYDVLGRPTVRRSVAAGSAPEVLARWQYDAAGVSNSLGRLTTTTSTTQFGDFVDSVDGYDLRGNPVSTTTTYPAALTAGGPATEQLTTTFGYNQAGLLTSTSYPAVGGLPAATVSTSYGNNGLFAASTLDDGTVLGRASYDNTNRPVALVSTTGGSDPNRLTRAFAWDDRDRLSGLAGVVGPDGDTFTELDYTYDYDVVGRPVRLTGERRDSATASPTTAAWCYSYDGISRLTRAATGVPDAGSGCAAADDAQVVPVTGGNYDLSYGYAQARLSSVSNGTTSVGYGYEALHPHAVTSLSGSGSGSSAGLPPAGALVYDDAGRVTSWDPVSGPRLTYHYDAQGNLVRTDVAGSGQDTAGAFDVNGIRVARTAGADEAVVYLGATEVSRSGGRVGARRVFSSPGGAALAVQASEGPGSGVGLTWLLVDPQGTVRLSKDAVSGVSSWHGFTPYGEVLSPVGALPAGRGFVGKTHDPDGEVRLDHRSFDPSLNVLTTPDPLLAPFDPQSLNAYGYSRNNPVAFSDPSGLGPKFCIPSDGCSEGSPSQHGYEYGHGVSSYHEYTPSSPRNEARDRGVELVREWQDGPSPLQVEVSIANHAAAALGHPYEESFLEFVDPLLDVFRYTVFDYECQGVVSCGVEVAGIVPVGKALRLAKYGAEVGRAAKATPELASGLERTGSALSRSDPFHRSVSWVVDNPAAQRFGIKGGDGVARDLYQLPGEVNGKSGVFEWIIDRSGTNPVINHQRFIPGGSVTGYPNQVVP